MSIAILWAASIAIAAMIGSRKDAAGIGFVWGLVLGPIGIAIIALSRGNRVTCPHCRALIDPSATRCRHCQGQLPGKPYG